MQVADAAKNMVYTLDGFTFEALFPKGQNLFDLPALTLSKDAITKVEIQQPEGHVVVEKEGETWKVTQPALSLPAQQTILTTLVNTLSNWKPSDYADASAVRWAK